MTMKFKILTLALSLLMAGTAQAAVHETPQPQAPAVVGKAHVATAATKKHKAAKKHVKSKKKGAKKHGKASAHKSTHHVH